MKRFLAASLMVVLGFPAAAAHSCPCAATPRERVVAATPVVFDGEVLRVEVNVAGTQEVTVFRVHAAVKGVPFDTRLDAARILRRRVERTVTILSSPDASQCGWDFRAGPQRLTVGALRDGPNLVTSGCLIHNLNRTILGRSE